MLRRDVPPAEVRDHARAVASGFDELWVVEDLGYAGGVSQVAAVLEATSGVDGEAGPVIGHGIAPAPFRNVAALAMEWATLAAMHPGRLAAGVGHGLPGWMAQIGASVPSPLTLLAETIEIVQQLLAGERVRYSGRYLSLEDVALQFPPDIPPLVSAGVMGPRSLELAGRVAGGTVLPEGRSPDDIVEARAAIERGRVRRPSAPRHRLSVFTGFYCGDLAELGPPPPDAPAGWAAIAETPDACAEDLQRILDAGVDSLILVPFGADAEQQLRHAAADIVPLLRRD